MRAFYRMPFLFSFGFDICCLNLAMMGVDTSASNSAVDVDNMRQYVPYKCLYYYYNLPSRCWSTRSPGHTFPGVLSDFQQYLSGTCCHKQFSSATLFSNLDLKLFLFTQAFTEHGSDLPPAPLKIRPYGAIEIQLLLCPRP